MILLEPVEPALTAALEGANWLSPFGAEIRYPGDCAETEPGDEERASRIAGKVREAVMAALGPFLSGQ